MLLKIEGCKGKIDTSNFVFIGKGDDGYTYKYNDMVIKLNESDYMTEEKVKDLRKAGVGIKNLRLVLPDKILYDAKHNNSFKYNLCFGYTQKFIDIRDNVLQSMTTDEFLNDASVIVNDLHRCFSSNQIAILDSNPNNLVYTSENKKKKGYLIDFDRNITPSSSSFEKNIVSNSDYVHFNQKVINLIMYKKLLNEVITINRSRPVVNELYKEYIKSDSFGVNFDDIVGTLKPYSTVGEYVKDKVSSIIKK